MKQGKAPREPGAHAPGLSDSGSSTLAPVAQCLNPNTMAPVSTRSIWYRSYPALQQELADLRASFDARCKELSRSPQAVLEQASRDIVARIVYESNWQEGIHLDQGRTKELAEIVFEDFDAISTPHVDFASVLNHHRKQVVRLKRQRTSIEELAAYNLSAAHRSLTWVEEEILNRQCASLASALQQFEKIYRSNKDKFASEQHASFERAFELVRQLAADPTKTWTPLTGNLTTQGEVFAAYLDSEFERLLNPLRITHLHFLHRLTLMGMHPTSQCGVFRKRGVHVSNPEIYFPPADAVPALMQEFCNEFPFIVHVKDAPPRDRIMEAARVSYRFVRIHPYNDGNGRLSRLLMNLVLHWEHPPVYLKADKKGRHRYSQALRRADRGNLEPLACLIALSLVEVYRKIIASISASVPAIERNGASRIASK